MSLLIFLVADKTEFCSRGLEQDIGVPKGPVDSRGRKDLDETQNSSIWNTLPHTPTLERGGGGVMGRSKLTLKW